MITKKDYTRLIFTVLFVITIFLFRSISQASESTSYSFEYYDYDFKEVELETTKNAVVRISNSISSSEKVVLRSVLLKNGMYFELITKIPWDGIEVLPGETVNFEIAFTPKIIGPAKDILNISTVEATPFAPNPAPTIGVELSGTGISNAEITIVEILEYFDSQVTCGSLIGNGGDDTNNFILAYNQQKKTQSRGEGKSAENRLTAFRNMLVSAGKLIEIEDLDGACRQLLSISKKCDGNDRPPDFVFGDVEVEQDPTPILENMIRNLSDSLDCK